jgi:hypothetical protein
MDDLARLRLSLAKLAPFVVTVDHHPGTMLDAVGISTKAKQLELI